MRTSGGESLTLEARAGTPCAHREGRPVALPAFSQPQLAAGNLSACVRTPAHTLLQHKCGRSCRARPGMSWAHEERILDEDEGVPYYCLRDAAEILSKHRSTVQKWLPRIPVATGFYPRRDARQRWWIPCEAVRKIAANEELQRSISSQAHQGVELAQACLLEMRSEMQQVESLLRELLAEVRKLSRKTNGSSPTKKPRRGRGAKP